MIRTPEAIASNCSHIPVEELPPFGVIQTHDLLRLQLQGAEERTMLLNPPALPEGLSETDIDYSPAAVRTSALKYAAEVLPSDVSLALEIDHDIRDSIAVHTPPTLESVVLLAQAWDNVRRDSETDKAIQADNDKIGAALGASIDFLADRETRDLFGHALRKAHLTGDSMLSAFHRIESEHNEHHVDDVPSYTRDDTAVPYYNIANPAYNPFAAHPDDTLVSRQDMMIFPAEVTHTLEDMKFGTALEVGRTALKLGQRDEDGTVKVSMDEFLGE